MTALTLANRRDVIRRLDTTHLIASRSVDPIGFMRDRLAQAEADYTTTGDASDLLYLRLLETSLNGEDI